MSITNSSNINYDVLDTIEETYDFYKENNIEVAIRYVIQNLAFAYIGVYNAVMCRINNKKKIKEVRNRVLKLKKKLYMMKYLKVEKYRFSYFWI